jgi:hypothetical protein
MSKRPPEKETPQKTASHDGWMPRNAERYRENAESGSSFKNGKSDRERVGGIAREGQRGSGWALKSLFKFTFTAARAFD